MEMDNTRPAPTNQVQLIMHKFNVPISKATIMHAAARFSIDMKKKGKS